MNLGEAIRSLRKAKGIAQKDLAEKSGISACALSEIERDKAFPNKRTIHAICDALGVATGVLLFSALTDDDIPQDKLPVFKALQKPLLEIFAYDTKN